MLPRLSVRIPFSLRAALTVLSLIGAVLVVSGLSTAPAALASARTPASSVTWNSQIAQQRRDAEHAEHVRHMAHAAHVATVRQRAAAAKAYALYQQKQAVLRREQAAAEASAQKQAQQVKAAAPVVTHTVSAPARTKTPAPAAARYSGSSSVQQCIISRESGGNPDVFNASGHYGLYQFSESTWVGSGGSAADFGHASVAEQNVVFARAVAARGYSDWAPYDGC